MKVHSVPSDESGCGLYRTYMPSAACGVEASPNMPVEWAVDPSGRKYVADAWPHDGADVVNLHRPLTRHLYEAIVILQSKGVAVAIDMDDDLQAIPKGIPSWDRAQPNLNPDENWRWALKAAQTADMVTVSTPQLASRYGKHGRVAVVENTVAPDWLQFDRASNPVPVVGWAGSPAHHPYDLEETAGEVATVCDGERARFHTVGHYNTLARLGFDRADATWQPWVNINQYRDAIARFDVGIVPLADSAFNRAKSWLKGLELAALGIPYVASPTPEYRRLGAGLMAKKPRDWNRHLMSLVTDEERRHEVAAAGREIAAGWTIDRHAHRWWEAWEQAHSNRRRASRRAA